MTLVQNLFPGMYRFDVKYLYLHVHSKFDWSTSDTTQLVILAGQNVLILIIFDTRSFHKFLIVKDFEATFELLF